MRSSHRIRIVSFCAAVVLALVALAGGIGPASAHDELLRSTPADGAVLGTPPAVVTLTFSGEQLPGAARLAATSDGGESVALTGVSVDGTTVTAPWPKDLPAGTYRVAWRSAGSDGHVLTGAFNFRYATPGVGPTAASPTGSPDVSTLATPSPSQPSSSAGFPWWIVAVLIIVAGGLVVFVVVSRNRRSGTEG